MKRITRRAIAAVVAIIFLLLGAGDVFGLGACPHHVAGANHSDAHLQGDEATDHGSHQEPSAPSQGADHAPCSCAGFCPTTVAPGAPEDHSIVLPEQMPENGVVHEWVAEAISRRFVPYFLPYSQAPPTFR